MSKSKYSNENNKYNKPLKWESPEALQLQIDEYFKWCDENEKPYTITGLALAVNSNKQTLLNYENCIENDWLTRLDEETKLTYVDSIKRAKLKCENYAEIQLLDPNCKKSPIGSIFALKNYGWKDRQEIVTTNNNEIEIDIVED